MDDLLVIGAGPYGLATAAAAQAQGVRVQIFGRPMSFWREQMPAGMFLRSGPDWHLDAAGEHTLRRYLKERGLSPADVDPIPIGVFLSYAEWFAHAKGLEVRDQELVGLQPAGDAFLATLADGSTTRARAVVAALGIKHFAHLPEWAGAVPAERWSHTVDMVDFDSFAGARVLIVGGRQSAYEWAALLADHGVERVDVVHRHDVPRFARVSWDFVDDHINSTLSHRGWWGNLPDARRDQINRKFWEVGRLTLEPWLTPRLPADRVRKRPRTEVLEASATGGAERVTARLSDGERLEVDHIAFACGFAPVLKRIPLLQELADRIDQRGGFPVLGPSFDSSVPGLYMPGFASTGSFGPFFGFVRGAPAAAELIVRDLQARAA